MSYDGFVPVRWCSIIAFLTSTIQQRTYGAIFGRRVKELTNRGSDISDV